MWRILSWTVLASTLGAIGKIYAGFIWTALVADILFLWLILEAGLRLMTQGTRQNGSFGLSIMLLLCAIALAQALNPGLKDPFTALAGYRSTGLYVAALLLPCVLDPQERHIAAFCRLLALIGMFSAINAVRQGLIPLHVEVIYAGQSGGAAKLYGDAVQGGANTFRPFSTFVTSVHLVLFLTMSAFITAFSDFSARKKAAYLIVILIGVLATLSRTAYIAFMIAVIETALVAALARPATLRKSIVPALYALALVCALIAVNPLLAARISTLGDIDGVSSMQSRLVLWGFRVSEIVNHPLGFGTGAASWAFKDTLDHGADSNYLKFLLEFGWVGGGIYLAFLAWLLIKTLAVQFSLFGASANWTRRPWHRAWLLSACAFVVTNLVQMISNQTLEAPPNNLLFWLSAGFICVSRVRRRSAPVLLGTRPADPRDWRNARPL